MFKKLCFFVILIIGLQGGAALAEAKASQLLVIACGLNPNSRSALLAKAAYETLKAQGQQVDFIDLRDYKLPVANGHDQSAYDDPKVKEIHDRIAKAQGIIIASPIYNYNIAASTKNLFELTSHPHKKILSGDAWQNKVVGFIGVSGSPRSLLAMFPFLNSLMMDAKVVIVPSFVMASDSDFNTKNQPSKEIRQAVDKLTNDVSKFAKALA